MIWLLWTSILIFFLSLPYWLPSLVIRLRMHIFTRINGEATLELPNEYFDISDFKKLYAHPAMSGRSKGALLSDLFWYWLSPGPEMHPEHLELSERYHQLAGFSRKIMALSRREIEQLMDQYKDDPLALNLGKKKAWTHIRLRDAFMPLWADFFYQIVFKEACDDHSRQLIVDHAGDVVNALKCVKLRDMSKRDRLTQYLVKRIDNQELPHLFPEQLSTLEKAHFLQGTFFNTAVVQMSEAMAHLILVVAQHPSCQSRLIASPDNQYLDDVINESLRLNPLFGIAHRITTDDIEVNGHRIAKNTVVCFNYPQYHKAGYDAPEQFNPQRWQSCPAKESNFIPFGVSANRSCPAQGLAMISMRQLTRHLFQNYTFASSIAHTRSLPNRGPCLVFSKHVSPDSWFFHWLLFPLMKFRDHWEDVSRSVKQLIFGTAMIIHASRLRLCEQYFQKPENQSITS